MLVTDGQVGNEDQILQDLGPALARIRVFTLGIDQAVNEAFLRRLAELGRGSCELVESEDRLDEVMTAIHRQIGTPLADGPEPGAGRIHRRARLAGARTPARPLPRRTPCSCWGDSAATRSAGSRSGPATRRVGPGPRRSKRGFATIRPSPPTWARGQVRKLEDRYVIGAGNPGELESQIVAVSIRHQVLSRFTAYVAIDRRDDRQYHRRAAPDHPAGRSSPRAGRRWRASQHRRLRGLRILVMDVALASVRATISSTTCCPPPSSSSRSHGGYVGVSPPRGSSPLRRSSLATSTRANAQCLRRLRVRSSERLEDLLASCLDDLRRGRPCIAQQAPAMGQGKSLRDLLTERRPGFEETARWIAEIAEALQDLLDRGFVHTDVTPARVVISPEGRAILTHVASHQVRAGAAGALAPETPASMHRSESASSTSLYDVRSSIYSLGVMLYEMLTGVRPFSGSTPEEILQMVSQGAVLPPRRVKRSIPKELEAICLKAMARKPEDRYATPGELAGALRQFLTGQPDRKKGFWKRK